MRHRIGLRLWTVCGLGIFLLAAGSVDAGSRSRRTSRPITRPKFDPTAKHVALFSGMEEGLLETRVVAKNSRGGSVLIKNTTDEPLTVELPEAFVAVQVNKQMGGGGMGGMGGGGMGGGGMGGGGNQSAGGGFGGAGGGGAAGMGMGGMDGGMGGGLGGMGGGMGGQGFFSIPPEKTVKLNYVSTCLEHGKKEPNSRVKYQMVPVDMYTHDAVLAELITMVGRGRLNPQAAQAAVWSRSDKMSWAELAAKFRYNVFRQKRRYFSRAQLQGAQLIVSTAVGRVREKTDEGGPESPAEAEPVRTGLGTSRTR